MTNSSSQNSSHNRLLLALSAPDFELLRPDLKRVTLDVRTVFEEPNHAIKNIYFLERGIASVVAVGARNNRIEAGLIGPEGMSGVAVVLGGDRSPLSTYIQAAGEGHRISATKFRKAMHERQSLHELCLKYVHTFMIQTAYTAMANARATITERLARWILMAHDRLDSETLPLTHEFLALMLGVRRAGVTEALHELQASKLIRSQRGFVVVLDRKALEREAGDIYGVPEAEFQRLFG